jgi:hypothetical protein
MPLNWSQVITRYGNGALVPTVSGGKFLKVARADYILYVANERATSVAHILRDLGFLDKTETFSIRC